MVNCTLCRGWGIRSETIVEYVRTTTCTNCDGTGKVPYVNGWRPFEATKETVSRCQCSYCRAG